MEEERGSFAWDSRKEKVNIKKHGINFVKASRVFQDPNRKVFTDSKHNEKEQRYFCIGKAGTKY